MKESKLLSKLQPSKEVMEKFSAKEKSQIPLAIYGNFIFFIGFSLTTVFEFLRGTYFSSAFSLAAVILIISSTILIKKDRPHLAMYLDSLAILLVLFAIVFLIHDKTNIFEIYRSIAFITVMAIFHQLFSLRLRQVRIFFLVVSIIWASAIVFLYIPYIQVNKFEAIAAIAIGTVALMGANIAIILTQQRNEVLNNAIEKEKVKVTSSLNTMKTALNQSAEGLEISSLLNSEVRNVTSSISNIESLFLFLQKQSEQLKESSQGISTSAKSMMDKVQGMKNSVSSQTFSLSHTSKSVAKVSGRVAEISSIADSNKESLKNMEDSLSKQFQNVKRISQEVERVSESSAEISKFVETVESISSQTGILAMNASIEAAHAGIAGKGFSVIAQEIRKLSELTSKEAEKISAQLKENNSLVESTLNSARDCVKYSETSTGEISSTIKSVEDILAGITEINFQTQEMKQTIDNIVQESNETDRLVEESVEAINSQDKDLSKVSDAASILREKIEELNSLITDIKIAITNVHDAALKNAQTNENISQALNESEMG